MKQQTLVEALYKTPPVPNLDSEVGSVIASLEPAIQAYINAEYHQDYLAGYMVIMACAYSPTLCAKLGITAAEREHLMTLVNKAFLAARLTNNTLIANIANHIRNEGEF